MNVLLILISLLNMGVAMGFPSPKYPESYYLKLDSPIPGGIYVNDIPVMGNVSGAIAVIDLYLKPGENEIRWMPSKGTKAPLNREFKATLYKQLRNKERDTANDAIVAQLKGQPHEVIRATSNIPKDFPSPQWASAEPLKPSTGTRMQAFKFAQNYISLLKAKKVDDVVMASEFAYQEIAKFSDRTVEDSWR